MKQFNSRIESLERIVENQADNIKSQQQLLLSQADIIKNQHEIIVSSQFSNRSHDAPSNAKSRVNLINAENRVSSKFTVEDGPHDVAVSMLHKPTQKQQSGSVSPSSQHHIHNQATSHAKQSGAVNNPNMSSPAANKKRLRAFVVGDSMMNGIDPRGLRKDHYVNVRNHPGATSSQMKMHVEAVMEDNPEILILHCGSNDVTKKKVDKSCNPPREVVIDTAAEMENIFRNVRSISPNMPMAWSVITPRVDGDYAKVIKEKNDKMRQVCERYKVDIIEHHNFDSSCLGEKGLHPNKKGNSILAVNYLNYMKGY